MTTTLQSSTVRTPPSRSFSELKRAVVDFVQGASDPELLDVAGRSINNAIDEMNVYNWIKLADKQDFTISVNQADYSIQSNVKDPMGLGLWKDGNPKSKLSFKEYRTLEEEHPYAVDAGWPTVYTIYYEERVLSLNLLPSQSFVDNYDTMRLRFFRRIPHMVDDSQRFGAPSEFSSYVMWQARSELATVRGETRLFSIAEGKSQTILSRLRNSDHETETDWSEY